MSVCLIFSNFSASFEGAGPTTCGQFLVAGICLLGVEKKEKQKQKWEKRIKIKVALVLVVVPEGYLGPGGADHHGLLPQVSFPAETLGLGHGSLTQ